MTGSDGSGDGGMKYDEATLEAIRAARVGGTLGIARREMASESGGPRASAAELQKVRELHVCMGLNACAGHDRDGTAPMAGMGLCATVLHKCHGANECRGQGGCGYTGPDAELAKPGEQACKWNGSCASPINASRVFAGGPLKGKSVWKLARQLFEARMYQAGVPFGPAPGEGYPDDVVPSYELDEQERREKQAEGRTRQGVTAAARPDGTAR